MKKYFLLLVITILLTSCRSYVLVNENSFDRVVKVDGEKDELFVKANNWMVENFYKANSVIQFSDRKNGSLSAKHLLHPVTLGRAYYKEKEEKGIIKDVIKDLYITFRVKVKDNAAKLVVNSPEYYYMDKGGTYGKDKYPLNLLKQEINVYLDSFEKHMKKSQVLDDNF